MNGSIYVSIVAGLLSLQAGWAWITANWRKRHNIPVLENVMKWSSHLLFLMLLSAVIKAVFFEIYLIPSGSMQNTLFPGDIIWVNKWKYKALPALKQMFGQDEGLPILVNDILVFKNGSNPGEKFLVKKCVALPGDEIMIRNNNVLVNNILNKGDTLCSFRYHTCNIPAFLRLQKQTKQKNPFLESGISTDNTSGWIIFTRTDAVRLSTTLSLTEENRPFAKMQPVFPWNGKNTWNIYNYGPYRLPQKGTVILLNKASMELYKPLMEMYEGCIITFSNKGWKIDGQPATKYRFKFDYYFFLGDNRHGAFDSRQMGPIPSYMLIGKAVYVMYNRWRKKFILRKL